MRSERVRSGRGTAGQVTADHRRGFVSALLVCAVAAVSGMFSFASSGAAVAQDADDTSDRRLPRASQVVGTAGSGFFAIIDGAVYGWGTVVQVAEPHSSWPGVDGSLSLLAGMPAVDPAAWTTGASTNEVIQLAAGADHVCALTIDNVVYCAGFDDSGQLGRGTPSGDTRAEPLVDPNGVFADKTIVQIAAGGSSSCALTSDGTIGCWGDDSQGQLGPDPGAAPDDGSVAVSSAVPIAIANADGGTVTAFADFKPIRIAMGDGLVCAVKGSNYGADGGIIGAEHPVACWGANVHGQLGMGAVEATSSTTPVDILDPGGALTGVRNLALAGGTACALTDGSAPMSGAPPTNISCWGAGVNGLTGQGSTSDLDVPTPVGAGTLAEGEFSGLTVGAETACASRDAEIVCWGSNRDGGLGNGSVSADDRVSTVTAVTDTALVFGAAEITSMASSGGGSVCATNVDGALGCWGSGSRFELGQAGSTASSPVPVAVLFGGVPLSATAIGVPEPVEPVDPVDPVDPVGPVEPVDPVGPVEPVDPVEPVTPEPEPEPTVVYQDRQLSVSPYAGCGIRSGSVYCWGRSLERGMTSSTPVLMKGGLTGRTTVQVAAAALTSCAIDDTGQLYCWGFWPGAGIGGPPLRVSSKALAGVTALKVVVGGQEGGCVLTSGHFVACWGDQRRLSHAGSAETGERYPVLVEPEGALAGKSVVDLVSGGANLTCALASDGSMACWGENREGGLGNGTTRDTAASLYEIQGSAVPVTVDLTPLGGAPIAQLTGGGGGVCALTTTSEIYCWGAGIAAGSSVPVRIPAPGLATIDRIAVTRLGICALDAGKLYCWGGQVSGELGVAGGATSIVAQPTRVDTGLLAGTRVAEVSSNGAGSTCALTTNDVTTCWGSNLYGALGAGLADEWVVSLSPEHSAVY
ncbi:hypothetical protein BH09ACT1_BH09ACT1_13940 [soil metagenome]